MLYKIKCIIIFYLFNVSEMQIRLKPCSTVIAVKSENLVTKTESFDWRNWKE